MSQTFILSLQKLKKDNKIDIKDLLVASYTCRGSHMVPSGQKLLKHATGHIENF